MTILTMEQQLAAYDKRFPPGSVEERVRTAVRKYIENGHVVFDPLVSGMAITPTDAGRAAAKVIETRARSRT